MDQSLFLPAKNEMVTPEKYHSLVNDEISDITYKVYKKYQETLLRNNSLETSSLLLISLIFLLPFFVLIIVSSVKHCESSPTTQIFL